MFYRIDFYSSYPSTSSRRADARTELSVILSTITFSLALLFSTSAKCETFAEKLNALNHALHETQKVLQNATTDSSKLLLTKINETTYQYNQTKIELVIGNIVKQQNIDIIVNAAHSGVLFGGGEGGVAGAIAAALGRQGVGNFNSDIQKRYPQLTPRSPENIGRAFAGVVLDTTDLGKEGYKFLINTVGPDCRPPNPENINFVVNAYRNTLIEAEKLKQASIIFPRISSAIFGCKKIISMTLNNKSTNIMEINNMAIATTLTYLEEHPETSLKVIYFIFFSDDDKTALKEYKTLLDARL